LRRLEYKWIVGVVLSFGLFMSILDATIVNVALPTLGGKEVFDTNASTIQWVVTAYLLSFAVSIPVSGWLGDRFGTKRTFMLALIVFSLGSLLCALSRNIQMLVGFRVLQGLGGGMLMPIGNAMLFRAFPPSERAAAGAIISIPIAIAPATGPILGGYLVEYHSWHWIFLINLPVGCIALLTTGLLLREETQAEPGRLDLPGFFLCAAGLALLLYGLAEAGNHGFDSATFLAFGLAGLAILGIFSLVELRTSEPLIDLRLFRDKLFRSVSILWVPSQAAFMGALFLLPLMLQAEMGFTPLESGLVTFPQAIGMALMAQPVARLYPRLGPRRLLAVGMCGAFLTTIAFLLVDLDTERWRIAVLLLARGFSFAFLMVPSQTTAYLTISRSQMGRATAVGGAVPQVAASLGVALLATILTGRLESHGAALYNPATRLAAVDAFHDAFLIASIFPVIALLATLLISDVEAKRAMREAEARTAEAM
jgi:EmrB/QacA subfamily drug resistance transporter